MFKLFGDNKRLKQWTLDNVLICDSLTVGTLVYFCIGMNSLNSLKTPVYEKEFELSNGKKEYHNVCDIPNVLLTMDENIYVGLDGAIWLTSFEVDCAAQPSDYVYKETPLPKEGGETKGIRLVDNYSLFVGDEEYPGEITYDSDDSADIHSTEWYEKALSVIKERPYDIYSETALPDGVHVCLANSATYDNTELRIGFGNGCTIWIRNDDQA